MYSSGVWSETMGPGSRAGGGGIGSAVRSRPQRRQTLALEIVLIALDLFLLAIHQIDVVAEEQVQVLVAVARQFLFDRLELEQQVVAERAGQRQPAVLLVAEFSIKRAQNGKRGGLLAALFFRKQRGQRLQAAAQRAIHAARTIPSADGAPAPAAGSDSGLRREC